MSTNQTVLWEETSKRTKNTKTFALADGSKQAVIFMSDVHYEDENGNLQDIDTTLHDEADFDSWNFPVNKHSVDNFNTAKNKVNTDKKANKLNRDNYNFQTLRVPFASKIPRNWKQGYTITQGTDTLTFKPVNASPSKGFVSETANNEITYNDAFNDVDVTLSINSQGIKETLTLKSSKAQTTYTFEVIGTLADNLSSGTLQIQPAWLQDSTGTNKNVTQTLRRETNGVFLDLVADVTGLTFPIVIDPTLTVNPTNPDWDGQNYAFGTPYPLNGPASWYTNQVQAENSWDIYNTQYDARIGVVKFDTTTVPVNSTITSASLMLYTYGGISNHNSLTLKVDWYPSNNTNNFSVADYTNPNNIAGSAASVVLSSLAGNAANTISLTSANINLVKGGYTAFRLGIPSSTAPTDTNGVNFYSVESSVSGQRPALTVIYNQPPTAPTLTSPNGGETWNASQTVTWTAATDPDTAQANLQYNIDVSTNNGSTWTQVVALTSPGVTSYTYDFSSISQSSTCLIRIRAYDGALYGSYAQSSGVFSIQHNLAPTAPTLLSPNSGSPRDRAQIIHLSWQHNDPNSDPQAKFDLMYSVDSGSTWTTVTQTTVNQYYDVPANTFIYGNVVWKVRTYDPSGLSGAYSAQATFFAGNKPAIATITAPTGTVAISRPTVTWSSIGQTSYQIQAINSLSVVVYDTSEVVSTNLAQTINYDLANNSTYTIQIRIKNSDGLWSDYTTSSIIVSYTAPVIPILTVNPQIGYINITSVNATPTGSQPTVNFNDIYRRNFGTTTWSRIATNIIINSTYSDYAVSSGQVYEYKLTALGTNGTMVDSLTSTSSINLLGVWIHNITNPSGTIYQFMGDGNGRDENWQPEAVIMQFAGRSRAMIEFGEMETNEISVQLELDNTDYSNLQSLIKSKTTLCFRDGRGRKIFGNIIVLPITDIEKEGYTTTIKIIETSYSEVV